MGYLLQLLNEEKELIVKGYKLIGNTHCLLNLFGLLRREDHADGRLRASLQHVLSFLIEAGADRVMLFECNQYAWQWRAVIVSLLLKVAGMLQVETRDPLDLPQPLDP